LIICGRRLGPVRTVAGSANAAVGRGNRSVGPALSALTRSAGQRTVRRDGRRADDTRIAWPTVGGACSHCPQQGCGPCTRCWSPDHGDV